MARREALTVCWLWVAGGACTSDAPAESDDSGDSSSATSAESSSAESTSTGSTNADSSDTGAEPDPVEIELGATCPWIDKIGEVTVMLEGQQANLVGTVFDRPDPWIGPAELEGGGCAFHRFATASCGTCEGTDVCAFDGTCVAQRLALTDAVVEATADGETTTIEADPITGLMYGTIGTGPIALRLSFAGVDVELEPLDLAALLPGFAATAQGDSSVPTALDAAWTPRDDGSRVRTVIPINHHAGGPTFTRCDVVASVGGFHADADMLTPLATITGLEYQGADVSHTAAVHTAMGCVEVRIGQSLGGELTWE